MKAIEAAEAVLAAAYSGDTFRDRAGFLILNTKDYETISLSDIAGAAIRAYLAALAEDDAAVERIADAITAEVELRQGKFRSPIDEARAAIRALGE